METAASNNKVSFKGTFRKTILLIKHYFNDWLWWDWCWSICALTTIVVVSCVIGDNIISILASVTGVISVILGAKGKTATFYFGMINVAFYVTVCYSQALFSNFVIYLVFFLPCEFIGLYLWNKNTNSNKVINEKYLGIKNFLIWIFGIIITIIAISFLINISYNNLSKSFLDTSSSIVGMFGMIMMLFRFKEQWILWISTNVLGIALWSVEYVNSGTNIALLLMWIVYLLNSLYGVIYWYFILNKKQD